MVAEGAEFCATEKRTHSMQQTANINVLAVGLENFPVLKIIIAYLL
jgi:hypothetical protein